MNKKTKLLIVSMLSLGLCASMLFVFNSDMVDLVSANISKPANMDCSYYFDNSEYRSIYDLNKEYANNGTDITGVTTWGTITDTYYNGSTTYQFIQSTDKNGNVGATCLYDINSAQVFPIGSVVSVTGTVTSYNGMNQIKDFTVTKDYDYNPSPVEAWDIDGVPSSSSSDFIDYRYMGTREVTLSNVSLGEPNKSRESTATLPNNKQVLLFYNSVSEKTAINNKILEIRNNGSNANVKGYLTYYSGNNTLQVLVRHVEDIEEVLPDKEISYLYVTTDKTFYYMDQVKMSDFNAKIYFTDDTYMDVTSAYITNTVDTSSTGYKTVYFAYESGGVTYTDHLDIYINNVISSLEVVDPVIYYAFNEQFITPTVYGLSYGYEANLTDEVEFSGFDSYWNSEYHSQVFVDYTNSAGKQLKTSYTYYVSSVQTLYVESPKLQFDLGEAFDYPAVYANFKCAPDENIDVSNRVTFSGFDSSSPGSVDVTFSFGDFSDTYEVEIIDTAPIELYEYNVSISGIGKYETGNYGKSGDFEYYRAVKQSGYLCKLIPLERQPGCEEPLGGSLYNIKPIKDIDHITLTYKTSDSNSTNSPTLYVGETNYDDVSISMSCSTSETTVTINLSTYDVNYFKFDSGDTTLYLKDIDVYYSGNSTPNGYNFVTKTTGTGEYRAAPTTYSGTLVDGTSSVIVPVSYDGSSVTEYKTYTYYSYDYVYEHPECISEATITNPVDVCNYFEAFGVSPANYGGSFGSIKGIRVPTKDEVSSLFGNDARCISKYERTDGYATAVPYYGETSTYYELDINTNGLYSVNSRQAGRIVAWATGFTGSDYGNGSQIVCTYTDDHYATFKEYNNLGSFLSRFNCERQVTGHVRGNPTTITY